MSSRGQTLRADETNIALLQKDVQYIRDTVQKIETNLEADYITRIEFEPIKKIVYGLIALVLTMVLGAVLSLIIRKP